MSLITSISGIRGTIGGKISDSLNPVNIVNFTVAYCQLLKQKLNKSKLRIVIGKDARVSGIMVEQLVCGTLMSCGADVVNIGFATTPTTEIAVINEKADGGIILTASHNPKNWNALKLLDNNGEFIDAQSGKFILEFASIPEKFFFSDVESLGKMYYLHNFEDIHIAQILNIPIIDKKTIEKSNFKIVVDCINSVGSIAIPKLLNQLGVKDIILLNEIPNGEFAHNPEPLTQNLHQVMNAVVQNNANFGIVVDPDVDRLAFIDENGQMFGEEYTLVSVADYVLQHFKGSTVSNLSSSRALRDIAKKHDVKYFASAIGELNVVEMMKQNNAVIGGEGNGGVIFPQLHYGRDALVGIALFLSHLAQQNITVSQLRRTYPTYEMVKLKKEVEQNQIDAILKKIVTQFAHLQPNTVDGVKIDFEDGWVHIRKSNTEPIIRIYAEAHTQKRAEELANLVIENI